MIAIAACLTAEQRGLVPGHDRGDSHPARERERLSKPCKDPEITAR